MADNTSVDLARVTGDNPVQASPDLLRAMAEAFAEALIVRDLAERSRSGYRLLASCARRSRAHAHSGRTGCTGPCGRSVSYGLTVERQQPQQGHQRPGVPDLTCGG
jgi:hypothetical protein